MGALIPSTGSNGLSIYDAQGGNPFAEAAAGLDQGQYLKFNGNTGEFTYGADDNELPYGSLICFNMFDIAFGWICWKDGEPVEEIMVKLLDGKPPLEHQLTDHGPYDADGDGWRESISVPGVLIEYDGDPNDQDVGTKMLFKGSSASTVRASRKLSGAFGKLFREHQGQLPVVAIDAESFQAKEKKFGKKYAPTFKIVGWMSEDEVAAYLGDTDDAEGDYETDPVAGNEEVDQVEQEAEAEVVAEVEPEPEAEPEAPAAPRGRRAAAAAPEAAPRGRRAAAPEPEAAAPRGRRAAAPEPEQAPRGRRASPDKSEDLPAPAPRGRSPERAGGAEAAGGRRVRRFN